MKINFDRLESRIKSLVESSSQLIASKRGQSDDRVTRLAAAVKLYLEKIEMAGKVDLPDSLLLEVPIQQAEEWNGFPFSETMQVILKQAGQSTSVIPQITVFASVNLLDGELFILEPKQIPLKLDRTASMPSIPVMEDGNIADTYPSNAYLIVNGLNMVPLMQSVFNIGRRLGNDLVIEDTRISREHAQIRAIKGQFVIFDLNSTGGTFVNSVRVNKQPIFPGDVISLAGVPLVYGEDRPPMFTKTGPVETIFDPKQEKENS